MADTEYRVLVDGGLGVGDRVAQKGDMVGPSQIGDGDTVKRWLDQGVIEASTVTPNIVTTEKPAANAKATTVDVTEGKPE